MRGNGGDEEYVLAAVMLAVVCVGLATAVLWSMWGNFVMALLVAVPVGVVLLVWARTRCRQ